MLPSECPDVQNLNSHCLQFSQQFCVTTNSASHQLPAIRAVCETKKSIPTTNPQCSPRTSSPGKSTKSPWLSLSRVTSHIHKPAPLLPVLSSRGHHSHLQYHGLSQHHLPHFTPWKSVISSSTVWTPPLSLPQQIFMLILDGALTKISIISGFIVFPSTLASTWIPSWLQSHFWSFHNSKHILIKAIPSISPTKENKLETFSDLIILQF